MTATRHSGVHGEQHLRRRRHLPVDADGHRRRRRHRHHVGTGDRHELTFPRCVLHGGVQATRDTVEVDGHRLPQSRRPSSPTPGTSVTARGLGGPGHHTYADAGTYAVTLTVTDDDGAKNTTSKQVTVTANVPPVSSFTNVVAITGDTVEVDGSASTDSDGQVVSYDWDFGDGEVSTGAKATHRYAAGGTYTVTLTVVDDGGLTGVSSAEVAVQGPNQAPIALFESSADGDFRVAFDASGSSDADGSITRYEWVFGDGATGVGATTNHVYATAGNYSVTLVVEDDRGGRWS